MVAFFSSILLTPELSCRTFSLLPLYEVGTNVEVSDLHLMTRPHVEWEEKVEWQGCFLLSVVIYLSPHNHMALCQ